MASKVHRVRYYNPKPELINCVSYNTIKKQIAIARGDASIEIWDLAHAPYLIKFIPGVENGSVEALGWVNNRLLSTGLGGALVEWDLDRSCVKTTVFLTGYAAWCLDVNSDNTTVAVGTEQGYVNLYNVENDDIVYQKLFDKQEGRIMCCKFNSAGNILATGSINTIRVWNVNTGYAISRMNVSRRGKETIVWCLAILADNILVSGDSHGRLTFWDGNLGEQIESYSTHKADILSIAISDDEKSLYFSGVDPVLTSFIKVDNKQTGPQWVKHFQRHIHEHDVRALEYKDNKLISVGVDGYLTLSSYPPKWVMRIPHMIPAPRSSVCAKKKLLLLRYNKHLEVWKLGMFATNQNGKVLFDNINKQEIVESKDNNNSKTEEDSRIDILNKASMAISKETRSLKLVDNPLKLVSIKTKGQKQIRCCEFSPTGEYIVYATDSDIRMLKLETDEEQTNTSLSKMILNGLPPTCDHIAFTEDSFTMAVHNAGTLYILQVDSLAGATVVQTINIQKHLKSSSIIHLYISKKTAAGTIYLVLADTMGSIVVFTKGEHKFEHYVTLPTYKCLPSALTIDSDRDSLIVAYVDQKVVEYELVNKKFTEWLNTALPPEWYSRSSAVTAVSAHPRRAALVFRDETSLWVLERGPVENSEPQSKRKSKGEKKNVAFKVVPIKYLADFHWIADDEAVTVEILPENIVSQLPPIISRK